MNPPPPATDIPDRQEADGRQTSSQPQVRELSEAAWSRPQIDQQEATMRSIRGCAYTAGYQDGRRHSEAGKPMLYSPSAYGNGFLDGWKSVRYSHTQNTPASSIRTLKVVDRETAEAANHGQPPERGSVLDCLTDQELNVARTVTQGMTNRQTGAILFISPKTVEHHLSRIYTKLKITSRTQLIRLFTAIENDGPLP
jgi:DNA-binding CsgD family transcriptional regulator